MRYVALVLAGLLLAAAVVFATLSPAERAGILRVARSPEATADQGAAEEARGAATGTRARAPATTGVDTAGRRARTGARMPADRGAAAHAGAAMPAPPSGLLIPVRGVSAAELSPTFDDARSEGRVHEALDIMAPAGTPVLAVADGHVEKLFDSRQGGLTIYQFEPGGRYAYYYAHLERYAPGLAEGQRLRRGEVIGYVGSTGNANPAAPHLHFAIFVLGPEKRWWEGTAIDPWPLLSGKPG